MPGARGQVLVGHDPSLQGTRGVVLGTGGGRQAVAGGTAVQEAGLLASAGAPPPPTLNNHGTNMQMV